MLEADQQERREAGQLPEDEQREDVVAERDAEHRAHEREQGCIEASGVRMTLEVSARIQNDECPNPRDQLARTTAPAVEVKRQRQSKRRRPRDVDDRLPALSTEPNSVARTQPQYRRPDCRHGRRPDTGSRATRERRGGEWREDEERDHRTLPPTLSGRTVPVTENIGLSRYREHVNDDPHKALRQDIHLLGTLLGETLAAQEGRELLQIVEHVRVLAKDARGGEQAEFEQLRSELSVDARRAQPAGGPRVRAFPQPCQRRRAAPSRPAAARLPARSRRRGRNADRARTRSRGCWPAVSHADALYEAVTSLRIELVLTAHPTEVSRRTLVEKYNRIAALFAERDRTDLTPEEQEAVPPPCAARS